MNTNNSLEGLTDFIKLIDRLCCLFRVDFLGQREPLSQTSGTLRSPVKSQLQFIDFATFLTKVMYN